MIHRSLIGSSLCLALLSLCCSWAGAQTRLESIQFKTGRRITGEIVEVKSNRLVLVRHLGGGTIKEDIPFDRIEAGSLYSALIAALKPLDATAHKRIAEAAFAAGLYPTAKRHFLKSAPRRDALAPDLARKVKACDDRDMETLLNRSMKELVAERFKRARSVALLAMKRHPDHPRTKSIPKLLDRIRKHREAARRRDLALVRTRREKAAWDAAEKTLNKLDDRIRRAARYETRSLRTSSKFRRSKVYLELGMRELHKTDLALQKLRQKSTLPRGLRPRLSAMDDEVITMQIRLRLHLASLYTIRGSFGTALSWANEALAFDPTDKQALDSRARIESAAAASSRGGRFITR